MDDDSNGRCIPCIVGKTCLDFQADASEALGLSPINASTGAMTRIFCCKHHTFLFLLEEVEALQQLVVPSAIRELY